MPDDDTRRPRLYVVGSEPRKDPPQRNVARKTAPRVTRGASKTATRIARGVWGTRWKVQKELQDSAGLAFIRRYLSLYDYSALEWITLNYSLGWYSSGTNPFYGRCRHPRRTSSGLFRINCTVFADARYPARIWGAEEHSSGERQPYYLNDENEVVVAIIALVVGHFLGHTGQIVGVEAIDFMKAAVAAYRRRDDALPGTLARVEWCVVCGKPLSKGGGPQSFCSDSCRSRYHNRLRGARIAARRGEKECAVCGKKFSPARSDARTCSPACRQKKYRERRKDRTDLHERV